MHTHTHTHQLYAEAGMLYEKAQCWDKATSVYIKNKNWCVQCDIYTCTCSIVCVCVCMCTCAHVCVYVCT